MKTLPPRSALTFTAVLVFATLTWGCNDSAQNPVSPSQTQADTGGGSGGLVTALHGSHDPDCQGPHKNDPGCAGGGGGGGDDASHLAVSMSDGFVMASTHMRVKRNNNKALNLEDSATVDINFGSLLDPEDDPNPSCELTGPGPGGNPTPNMAELRATFTVGGSFRDLSIQIDKKTNQGAIRALPLGAGLGENWFSFCFNTGLGLCNVQEGQDIEGNTTYTLTGSGARAVHGGWALMCPNDGSASVTITVKPVS